MALLPFEGSIVNCFFPTTGSPFSPSKLRKALVLERAKSSETQEIWILVAYASGQGGTAGNKNIGPFQLEIQPAATNSCTVPTVIHLDRAVWLPYNSSWFKFNQQGNSSCGRVSSETFSDAENLFKQHSAVHVSQQPPFDPSRSVGPVKQP